MKPVVLRAGEGERVAMGAARVDIKATGEDTTGSFYLPRDLASAASDGRTLTSEEIGRIAARHDFRAV